MRNSEKGEKAMKDIQALSALLQAELSELTTSCHSWESESIRLTTEVSGSGDNSTAGGNSWRITTATPTLSRQQMFFLVECPDSIVKTPPFENMIPASRAAGNSLERKQSNDLWNHDEQNSSPTPGFSDFGSVSDGMQGQEAEEV